MAGHSIFAHSCPDKIGLSTSRRPRLLHNPLTSPLAKGGMKGGQWIISKKNPLKPSRRFSGTNGHEN